MAIIKIRGKFALDYWYQGNRYREVVGTSKRMAEKAHAVRIAEIAQGRYQIKQHRDIRFEALAKEYIGYAKANKKSWLRDEGMLKNLLPVFGKHQLGAIAPFAIEHYKQARMTKVKPATVNREIALLKHMFNLAIQWGMVSSNPMKGVKLLREDNIKERILSPEEISRLLEACTEYSRPIVMTALHTGMRKGEVLGLRWSQVDFENKIITILNSKSGKPRKIPINQTLLKTLAALKYNSKSEYVFITTKTKNPPAEFKVAWRNALRKAGIVYINFHQCRHSFASHLVASGVDLVTVKELLGHSTLVMTQRYLHAAAQSKVDAVDQLVQRFDAGSGHLVDTRHLEQKTTTLQVVAK